MVNQIKRSLLNCTVKDCVMTVTFDSLILSLWPAVILSCIFHISELMAIFIVYLIGVTVQTKRNRDIRIM